MASPEAGGGREARATCAGCGLVCDDIVAVRGDGGRVERLERTCPLGDAWFAERVAVDAPPARVDGRAVDLEAALDAAAAILAGARVPLVYGLGQATCEDQRAAVALAEALGATIDPAGPALDGAFGGAFPARGASTATLGEVRDRSEVVVIWRADPATSHPRLFERLRLPAADRHLVVVGERRTATAERADAFVELAPDGDVEALWRLRTLVREGRDAGDSPLGALAARLRGCRHGAILHHVRDPLAALAIGALGRDLTGIAHVVALTLRHEPNAAGADDVLAWQTGYPSAVSFASGHPRSSPGELSAAAMLERGDADAALVVGSDPLAHMPPAAVAGLRAMPFVSVDARDTATAQAARVAFTTSAPGIHRSGVVHRLDGVPVPLRAVLVSDRPSAQAILEAIGARLAEGEAAA
jgi:formylmethanofuran dehydrogenase subunit B